MIIIDYNALAIAPFVQSGNPVADEEILRHQILNSIRMYRRFNKAKFGEVIVVMDGGGNWRKDVFPHYKASRGTDRTKSPIDWKQVFGVTESVFNDITEHFPYRTFKVRGCEADDVIAVLAKQTQEFGQNEPVMIVSPDKDFGQLQKYANVKQISPRLKKEIIVPNPRLQLQTLIIDGDRIDGIPNVLSADDVFVSGGRQTPMRADKMDKLIADPTCMGPEVYRNYQRNKKLIDFDEMPEAVFANILNIITANGDKAANKRKVVPYLINNQCMQLLESVEDFI